MIQLFPCCIVAAGHPLKRLSSILGRLIQLEAGSWKEFIRSIPSDITAAQEMDQSRADKAAKQTGVFSLSETESSILMWSHYGKNHTGFCIGFRTRELYTELWERAKIILTLVEYQELCPTVNPYDPGVSLNSWFSPFTVKHSDWSYEKEWRVIFLENASAIIPLSENVIDSVYLGMRIDKDDEKTLINKLRMRKLPVNLFRASKLFNSFEIKFEKVEY
ncbi:MAG: DUF2971 domain-containing protein [Candidatus Kapaibacterium sp.]